MIKINRGPEPEFLKSKEVQLAKEKLRMSFENSQSQERLRFDYNLLTKVKDDLIKMCHGKCAYCESKISLISEGVVENFRPMSGARGLDKEYAPNHYWWLAYEWENLLFACELCSVRYKRDYFPIEEGAERVPVGTMGVGLLAEKTLLIDPTIEAPSAHLDFTADGIVIPKTKKGKVTIDILKLNRPELVNARKQEAELLLERLDNEILIHKSKGGFIDEDKFNKRYKAVYDIAKIYVATRRTVFENWKLKNSAIFGTKKKEERHTQNIKKETTKGITNQNEASAIQQVDDKLSNLKRFTIKSIEIQNFRSIDHLILDITHIFEEGKESRESWLLVLGDNGIGKSSILQAVALALAGRKQLDKLDLDVLDILKRGEERGYVKVQSYEHDKPIELHFDKNGFATQIEEAPTFVMAYGSVRLLPRGSFKPDLFKEPYLNIRNLFDYSVSLLDPNEWLGHIGPVDFEQKVAPALFDVLALREGDRVEVNDRKISIRQYGEDHELENNSDGFKTVVGLVADIMQTLSTQDSANYHNAQGIVLIDELGNHLHPRWRLKVVGALRKAFPGLQFIVTSHEPLCLRGLAYGEVVVLVRDENQKIRALDKNLLPDHSLMRIDQLLTSDLFGLINVMDEETEKTYEQYYALLSKKEEDRTMEDKARIEEYNTKLAEKELLGSTPQVQAMFKVANETAIAFRKEGFRTKENLKEETVAQVKTILDHKNIDWL